MESDATAELARELLSDFGLTELNTRVKRPVSGHRSSILVPCAGEDGKRFLLKVFEPPALGRYYPPEIRFEDFARREAAFYRFLESWDPDRRQLHAPKAILIDPRDPPRWILLEWIECAVGPIEEILSADLALDLLDEIQSIPLDAVFGRRDFPLNRWDTVSFVDRMRMMYDPLIHIIGEDRWKHCVRFFHEALRWTETRPPVLVHGDFAENNLLVDVEGVPHLVDFERVGTGSGDHDFAWFWIQSTRPAAWKKSLFFKWMTKHHGSDRLRAEWAIRSSVVYVALRKLRFSFQTVGESDPEKNASLALLDAALEGGSEFFPY